MMVKIYTALNKEERICRVRVFRQIHMIKLMYNIIIIFQIFVIYILTNFDFYVTIN